MSVFFAVSGVKNSGKTTLITKLLPVLTGRGLKVATIKHDGHDFQTDVPGTDTFAHFQAGAYGTVVFSDHKYMVVKKQPEEARAGQMTPEQLASWFPEADLILLEGFKDSGYPKVELIRGANSSDCVCRGRNLRAIVTDLAPGAVKGLPEGVPVFGLEDVENIAEFILKDLFLLSRNTKEII
ncbi:molybdopterin-guanine dinucleotide biosynthesis protein B [Candidatus Merdisoma sp. HCP28S3_D10]|uniref:molybdopterin-guanine dinucleotide biosynthesis protein B n=1 Tax=unclassified Candidatus Merdisoma TaxID=3099611 RepID=UPI003F8C463A